VLESLNHFRDTVCLRLFSVRIVLRRQGLWNEGSPPSKESYRKCVSLNETESCALLIKAVEKDSVRI
jgi:hypothetical protein